MTWHDMGRGIASSTHLSSFFLLLCGVTAANTQCTPPAMHRSQLEPLTGMHLSFFFLHSLLQTWSSSSASTGLFLAREGRRRPPWPGCLAGTPVYAEVKRSNVPCHRRILASLRLGSGL